MGKPLMNGERPKTPWERWALLAVVVLAVAVGAFLLTQALANSSDSGQVAETTEATTSAQPVPKKDSSHEEVQNRRAIVALLENDVEKDAKKRVRRGELDGPVLRVQCDPAGGTDIEDLTIDTGDYDCLAVQKETADGTAEGYQFSATVNFAEESYTWKLGS